MSEWPEIRFKSATQGHNCRVFLNDVELTGVRAFKIEAEIDALTIVTMQLYANVKVDGVCFLVTPKKVSWWQSVKDLHCIRFWGWGFRWGPIIDGEKKWIEFQTPKDPYG